MFSSFFFSSVQFVVRPSGTEPKIKFYMEVRVPMARTEDYNACSETAKAKVEALKKDLGI